MSTTPDPTTPVEPTHLDPTPVEPVPVSPDLDVAAVDPAPTAEPPTGPAAGDAGTGTTPDGADGADQTAAQQHESELKALYAAAGATQVLLDALRETVTETSRWANARLSELRFRRAELAKQAEEMRSKVEGLPDDVRTVPDVARSRVTDLQQQANGTYSDLASRGQRALHDVRTDVVSRIDPAFDKLQERLEAARRAIRGAAVQVPEPPAAPAEDAAPAPAADPGVDDAVLVEDVVVVEEVVVPDPRPSGEDGQPLR